MTEEKDGYHVGGAGDGSAVGVLDEPLTLEEHARLEDEWIRERSLCEKYGGWPRAKRLLAARKVYGYCYGYRAPGGGAR